MTISYNLTGKRIFLNYRIKSTIADVICLQTMEVKPPPQIQNNKIMTLKIEHVSI